VAGGLIPGTTILDLSELASSSTNLMISGDTGSGGGPTSLITVRAGSDASVDDTNAITFTPAFSDAITAINVTITDDNDHALTLKSLNLPGVSLNITGGTGNTTVTVGSPGDPGGPSSAPPLVLNSFNWIASNLNSTTTQSVSVYNAAISQITIRENSGTNDVIRLWGVSGNSFATLSQNNGSGDSISIDQLNSVSPPAISNLGQVTTTQGGGSGDTVTVNNTNFRLSYTATQGNGANDRVILGSNVIGDSGTPPPGSPGSAPITITQGSGNGAYIGIGNVVAGVVTLTQQDLSTNTSGDTIGGPIQGFPTRTNNLPSGILVPSDGFANAVLQQLVIVQGSAPGDVVAICQLQQGDGMSIPPASASESLQVTGGPFIPGVPPVTGTILIVQQDVAGNPGDFVLLGSYIGPYSAPTFTGSITATNEVVVQGNGSGDFLDVLFNTMTSPTPQLSSLFLQGNGSDQAFFQEDTEVMGGYFVYVGGAGGNYVQADSNNALGVFDGGPLVPFNILGQDNNNSGLIFIDFGNVIIA
jgi:hypothetical protein